MFRGKKVLEIPEMNLEGVNNRKYITMAKTNKNKKTQTMFY